MEPSLDGDLSVDGVGDVDDRSSVPASTTSSVRPAGLSTSTVGVKDPSLWTKAILKSFCEQHGLTKTGKKQDLLTR